MTSEQNPPPAEARVDNARPVGAATPADSPAPPESPTPCLANGAGSTDFASKIQVLAGLLVAAFAGTLNFIGLSGSEVSTVLRNEAHYPTLVFDLLVAGILTAVASIFVKPAWTVSTWAWVATAGALVVPASLSVAWVRIRTTTSRPERFIAESLAAAGAAVALVGTIVLINQAAKRMGKPELRVRKGSVTAQGLLVFSAIALTATASYAGLRLETISQLNGTAAQLAPALNENGPVASLTVTIDASRLANVDRINVAVVGLKRATDISKFCLALPNRVIGTLTCSEAPCYISKYADAYPAPSGCDQLSSGVYQPNNTGTVHQLLTMPFSDTAYQRIELVGTVCTVANLGATTCTYQSTFPITRVDIQIPKDR